MKLADTKKALEDKTKELTLVREELREEQWKNQALRQGLKKAEEQITESIAYRARAVKSEEEIAWLRDTIQGLTKTRHEDKPQLYGAGHRGLGGL